MLAKSNVKADEPKKNVANEEEKRTEEDNREVALILKDRRALRVISMGGAIAALVMALITYLVFGDTYRININGTINRSQLSTYWHRIEFVICYQIIGISWILACMYGVIWKRLSSQALNPLAEHEHSTQSARNILTNSVEQFLMSFFAQIISISFLEANIVAKIIPLVNLFFIVGRIAFWLGYPNYRTFGFVCTALPNTLLIGFSLFKFIQSLFF